MSQKREQKQLLETLKKAFESIEKPDQLADIIENYPVKNPVKNLKIKEKKDLRAYLYFVGPFSGSPSSVFGHIFIVFDDKPPGPFSEAYGYSALVDSEEGFFKYVYKGLNGGYKGVVSKDELYMFWRKYSALEDREIYLFEIDPIKTPVESLYQAMQEPENYSRPYYFRYDNCATFIRRLFYGIDSPIPFEEYPYSIIQKLLAEQEIKLVDYFPTRAELLNQKLENSFSYQNALYDQKASKLVRLPELRKMAKMLAEIKQDGMKPNLKRTKNDFANSHDPHRFSGWYGKDDRIGLSYRHFFQGLNDSKVFRGYRDFLEFAEFQLENFESFYLKKLKLFNLTTNKTFSLDNKKISSRFDAVYDHFRYESFESRRSRVRTGLGIYKNYSFFEVGTFLGPSIGSCDSDFCAPILTHVFLKVGESFPLSLSFNLDWESDPWRDEKRELLNYEFGVNIRFNSAIRLLFQFQKTSLKTERNSFSDDQWIGQINRYF